jgi:hypothetical protein
MKNKLFSFQFPAVATAIRTSKIQWVFFVALIIGQANVMACNLAQAADVPAVYDGWTFHGEATLATAANPSAAIYVAAMFEDYAGFSGADMQAALSGDGGRLYVTISNVSISELPANVVLGTVTVVDEDGQRVFVVKTDGTHIVVDDEF